MTDPWWLYAYAAIVGIANGVFIGNTLFLGRWP